MWTTTRNLLLPVRGSSASRCRAGECSRRREGSRRASKLRVRATPLESLPEGLARSVEAIITRAGPLPGQEDLSPGWGLELGRELCLQALFKLYSLIPLWIPLPEWQDVESAFPSGGAGLAPPEATVSGFAFLLTAVFFASLNGTDGKGANDEWARLAAEESEKEPEELKTYDPEVSREYFLRRPASLIKRGWRSSLLLGFWSAQLIVDAKLNRRPEDDEDAKAATDAKRASQLRSILIRLGPTYVKLGQVLSSRQDLLPKPYIEQLQTLQDAVPPYGDDIAMRLIAREIGQEAFSRLDFLSPSPVASASLGQVYEAVDKVSGEKIAVKVQRPGALCAVSLDVAIIRLIGPVLYRINEGEGGNLDAKGLVDEWGTRFVEELDYRLEARNATQFQREMTTRDSLSSLSTSVFAPAVFEDLSSRRVLVTEWIDGKRIDQVGAEERGRLCALTLSSYLAMLLETGVLHADPHPGNLLVTPDGKIAVLDWGLVTPVTGDQRRAILTFIAHLCSSDYDLIDQDLKEMGFVPQEKLGALKDAKLTRAIGTIFAAAAAGGGAGGFRKELGFDQSDEELRELGREIRKIKGKTKKETELLRRDAFIEMTGGENSKVGNSHEIWKECRSILEGIGLATDPSYSLASEAFPFVARRLLTDRSEATSKALKCMLYGENGTKLSVEQAKQLAQAFGEYSVMTDDVAPAEPGSMPVGVKEALRVAFAPEGGPLQDIMLKEMARLSGATIATVMNDAVKAMPLPIPIQGFVEPGLESLASVGGKDSDAFEVASIINEALSKPRGKEQDKEAADSNINLLQLPSQEAVELAIELAPGIQTAALRFASSLLEDAAERIGSVSSGKRP
ncbi:ABC1 domain-containing protein [Chloropicon primus]|uniref:ABC1 domain-containing protein n=2 Tax=Chloropicon primus TaxID=1764295 RepID=A0A5B8MDX7_9CHLO|nr:ABC1 domain-containing protein [Chloropicon primus]|eukprot:QDZ18818.1 ABC1 domain-containing protein [Chloropicon primus]